MLGQDARSVGTRTLIGGMSHSAKPTISAVVTAYQAERWIAETLESILGQTRPPDEVVVVDDGSTDGTAAELERYGDRIRVVRQPNGGYQAGMNRAIAEATCEFVALCGADDLWESDKLKWQEQAIIAHPEVDVLCGHAVFFGSFDAEHARPPVVGAVDGVAMRESLFRMNWISTSSVAVRRDLFERMGPFIEHFMCEDWHYWMQCLRADVRFYYDPRLMVGYRQHDENMTNDRLTMREAVNLVHSWHADLIEDRRLVRAVYADDLFRIARLLVKEGRPHEARRAFRRSLRYASCAPASASLRALAWIAVLSLPGGARESSGRALVGLRRASGALASRPRPAFP